MEIVTEINEKVYQKLSIPKENIPEMIHSTKRFGYQKSQNVWSIEFLPKFFDFLKKLVKILIKMLGQFQDIPAFLENKIFTCKNFVYNCLLVFTRIYENLAKIQKLVNLRFSSSKISSLTARVSQGCNNCWSFS